MKHSLAIICLCATVALVSSHPLDSNIQRVARQSEDGASKAIPLSREKRTIGFLRDLFPNFSRDDNSVASSNINEVRIKREAAQENPIAPASDANGANASEEADTGEDEDLDSEATGDNEVTGDSDAESSEAEEEEEDEPEGDDRNKRFLNFNVAATDSANGGGGSGGGSGNFLFDIIRLVAGSGSGSGSSGSGDSPGTQDGKSNDEAAYGVGVPGPLTRLFVVANRGVASLIQDLILRLAQTSERIVNFKARLITSII